MATSQAASLAAGLLLAYLVGHVLARRAGGRYADAALVGLACLALLQPALIWLSEGYEGAPFAWAAALLLGASLHRVRDAPRLGTLPLTLGPAALALAVALVALAWQWWFPAAGLLLLAGGAMLLHGARAMGMVRASLLRGR